MGDDGLQNMYLFQSIFIILQTKKDKSTDYIFSWKSKGLYNYIHSPQHTAFLHGIKLFGYKMRT